MTQEKDSCSKRAWVLELRRPERLGIGQTSLTPSLLPLPSLSPPFHTPTSSLLPSPSLTPPSLPPSSLLTPPSLTPHSSLPHSSLPPPLLPSSLCSTGVLIFLSTHNPEEYPTKTSNSVPVKPVRTERLEHRFRLVQTYERSNRSDLGGNVNYSGIQLRKCLHYLCS